MSTGNYELGAFDRAVLRSSKATPPSTLAEASSRVIALTAWQWLISIR